MSTIKQWFDRSTLYGLLSLLIVHGIAWITQHTIWSAIPFAILIIGTFFVTKRSLVWGFALVMLEIIIGGHGHLIDVSLGGATIGLRLGMFCAVMLGVAYHIFFKKVRPTFVFERDMPIIAILIAVIIGFIIGIFRNPFGDAFDDANAFVTLGYLLPVAMIVWTNEAKRIILWTFALGATWIAISSVALLYLFSHLSVDGIWALYHFVRDARLAEVTLLSGPAWLVAMLPNGPWFFRVFEPAQAFVMFFTLVLCSMMCFITKTWRSRVMIAIPLVLMFAVDISSQSRSFWIGLFVGGLALSMVVLYERISFREILRMKIVGSTASLIALLAIWVAVVIPIPQRPDLTNTKYYRGQDDDTRELAVSSRWNLLGPMMDQIEQSPVWGSGFGTSVTFISDDPRLREINPNGEWTTYRFEWGFHDIWIKMGIPGLLAFGWFFFTILKATIRSIREKEETRWLTVSLCAGIIALFASHAFSPYLNHPIGLGFMIMVLPFFSWQKKPIPSMANVLHVAEKVALPPVRKAVTVRE
jgi:O-antigen ligase